MYNLSDTKQIFSEVDGVLNMMGQEYINLIPKKLYELIEDNKDKNIKNSYKSEIPLTEQKISKEAISMICLIHYNYWCKTQEERNQINKILLYNQEKNNEKRMKNNNVFVQKPNTISNNYVSNNMNKVNPNINSNVNVNTNKIARPIITNANVNTNKIARPIITNANVNTNKIARPITNANVNTNKITRPIIISTSANNTTMNTSNINFNNNQLTTINKQPWYKKIIEKIKEILKK